MGRLHAGSWGCSYSSVSSTYLGAGEDESVEPGTSAGGALSGEGAPPSELPSSEASGDGSGVGEGMMSLGDALGGRGASGGVELFALGRMFSTSCRRMVWNSANLVD